MQGIEASGVSSGVSHWNGMRLRERKSRTSESPADQRSADDANAVEGWLVAVAPGTEQVIEHGVKLFLGRIPRLVQVVVNLGGVDGADGRFGVRVGGQQHAFRVRVELHGALQEFDPGHAGHALVGQKKRDHVAAILELLADIERGAARCGAQDAVRLARNADADPEPRLQER